MLQCQHTGACTGCNFKTRSFNIFKITVSVVALSDHNCVFFHVNAPVHKDTKIEVICKWHINEMTRELFSHTISSLSPLCGLCPLSGAVNKLVDEFSFRITDFGVHSSNNSKERLKWVSPWRNKSWYPLSNFEERLYNLEF